MINSKIATKIAGFSLLTLYSQNTIAAEGDKMNVLFLLVDDLRSNSLGCFGNDITITPNIDQLANDGIKFPNAAVTSSISMVSRASLLTGQYMCGHKINNFGISLSDEKIKNSYPNIAQENGYYTGHVGKYGVGQIRKEQFDYQVIYEGRHWLKVNDTEIHVTEKNKQDALDFLRTRPKEDNFVLNVSFFATHAEDGHKDQYRYQPSSEQYYTDVVIPNSHLDNDEAFYGLPDFLQNGKNEGRVRWYWRFDTPERYQKYMKAYYRMLTEVDLAVGEIIKELKVQGVYENTLIVFMGDNGYFLSDRRLADKWYPYHEGVNVPLIVHDPRLDKDKKGMSNDEFVLNVDIAPTIVNAIGAEIPECMQGVDISPLYLSGKRVKWRQEFFYEHPTILGEDRIPSSEGLIRHNEKFVWWPEHNYEQYFNLKRDKDEIHNEIDNKKYSKKISEMREVMENYKSKYSN